MRIGLDARYASDHFPGIGRYIVGLARALAALETGHTLVLIAGPRDRRARYDLEALGRLPGVELARLRAGPFGAAQHLALPALARRLRLDLLHAPYFVRPILGLPCPAVVTLYDLLGRHMPGTLSWRGRLLYRASLALSLRGAAAVITISESARADIARLYGLPAARLAVTPLAADGQFRPRPAPEVAAARARLGLPERYALYVGSNKPHKNLLTLARAWELLGERRAGCALVIAGHEDRRHPELRRHLAERGAAGDVRLLPNVPEGDLPALYSGAEAFVFPSLYEGFGLPPLEAMACGAPVLCSRAASLPEVVGDAALTFDPTSPEELATGLARVLGDAGLRRELRARGLRRAREFSWRRTALGTLRVYEAVTG